MRELKRRLQRLEAARAARPEPEDEETRYLKRTQRFLHLKRLEHLGPDESDPGPPPLEWIRTRLVEIRRRSQRERGAP